MPRSDPQWGEAQSPTDSRLDTLIELIERNNELLEIQLGIKPKPTKKPERVRD